MLTIQIDDEFTDAEELASALEKIAELIRFDYRTGDDPRWDIYGEDENAN